MLDRMMETFDLAVGLGTIGRGPYMGHPRLPDEGLEIASDVDGAIIGDDPGPGSRELLKGPL